MPYEFEVELKDGYILFTASGVLASSDDLKLLDQALQREVVRFDCRRLLIDERAAVKTITPHDFIVFSESKMDEIKLRLKIGVVYSPEKMAEHRWIETVLQNRSVAFRQFSSMEEAEKWLLSDPSNPGALLK